MIVRACIAGRRGSLYIYLYSDLSASVCRSRLTSPLFQFVCLSRLPVPVCLSGLFVPVCPSGWLALCSLLFLAPSPPIPPLSGSLCDCLSVCLSLRSTVWEISTKASWTDKHRLHYSKHCTRKELNRKPISVLVSRLIATLFSP